MKKIVRFSSGYCYWPPYGGMFVRLIDGDGGTIIVRNIVNVTFGEGHMPTRIETLNTIYVQVAQ